MIRVDVDFTVEELQTWRDRAYGAQLRGRFVTKTKTDTIWGDGIILSSEIFAKVRAQHHGATRIRILRVRGSGGEVR